MSLLISLLISVSISVSTFCSDDWTSTVGVGISMSTVISDIPISVLISISTASKDGPAICGSAVIGSMLSPISVSTILLFSNISSATSTFSWSNVPFSISKAINCSSVVIV